MEWKIQVEMKRQYISSSYADVLFHQIKKAEDIEMAHEKLQLSKLKFQMRYKYLKKNIIDLKVAGKGGVVS